jgi:hypothetical protein
LSTRDAVDDDGDARSGASVAATGVIPDDDGDVIDAKLKPRPHQINPMNRPVHAPSTLATTIARSRATKANARVRFVAITTTTARSRVAV